MPHVNEFKVSRLMRKEHLPEPPKGVRVIIAGFRPRVPLGFQDKLENVLDIQPHRALPNLPIKLSNEMLDQIMSITGESDPFRWAGKEIVIFHDPAVLSANKPVGGIRARAPKGSPAANVAQASAPAPAPAPVTPPDDEDFEVVAEEPDPDDMPF